MELGYREYSWSVALEESGSAEFSNDFSIPVEIMLKKFTFLTLSQKLMNFKKNIFCVVRLLLKVYRSRIFTVA